MSHRARRHPGGGSFDEQVPVLVSHGIAAKRRLRSDGMHVHPDRSFQEPVMSSSGVSGIEVGLEFIVVGSDGVEEVAVQRARSRRQRRRALPVFVDDDEPFLGGAATSTEDAREDGRSDREDRNADDEHDGQWFQTRRRRSIIFAGLLQHRHCNKVQ